MCKKILTAVFCIMMLFCASVSAADFKEGDIAYVKKVQPAGYRKTDSGRFQDFSQSRSKGYYSGALCKRQGQNRR